MSRNPNIHTRRAGVADIELLGPLFDAYRVFYGKASDVALARAFLLDRLRHDQSVVFIALRPDGTALGFTQLYPIFSSISLAPAFVLNDLYVAPEARRTGVAVRLLGTAADHGRGAGAVRLSLSTAIDNLAAQTLYASLGWVRDTRFHTYALAL